MERGEFQGDFRLLAQMLPQGDAALAPIAMLQKSVLIPPDQWRNQQTGKAKIIAGLQRKADGGEQVLHHQRLQ